jgi:hypothetical protein
MTTVTAPRPAAIAAVLAKASQWTHGTRKSDGREFYFVPGSKPDAVYMADASDCTCPDARERGRVCKHSLAVAQYRASREPQPAPPPKPRPSYADLFPACAAGCGDLVERKGEMCWPCLSAETRRLDLAERRAS